MARMKKKQEILEQLKEFENTKDGFLERTKEAKLWESGYRSGYIKALKWVLNRGL